MALHQDNLETVCNAPFHALDEALNALFQLKPDESMAQHAAYGFWKAGTGAGALSSWIHASGDGKLPLVTAVGSALLAPAWIPTAIKLLAACNPPNYALYNFIHHNSTQLDVGQRREVIRLVTWPVRYDTAQRDVLGWVALRSFPDAPEIQRSASSRQALRRPSDLPSQPADRYTDPTIEKFSSTESGKRGAVRPVGA